MNNTLQDAIADAIYKDCLARPDKYLPYLVDCARYYERFGLPDRTISVSWGQFESYLKNFAGDLCTENVHD